MQERLSEFKISVNGKAYALKEPCSVTNLLKSVQCPTDFVAVAVNQTCILRRQFATTILKNGDQVEILTPQAGG